MGYDTHVKFMETRNVASIFVENTSQPLDAEKLQVSWNRYTCPVFGPVTHLDA